MKSSKIYALLFVIASIGFSSALHVATNDGVNVKIDDQLVTQAVTLKAAVEEGEEVVPLPNVAKKELDIVIKWMRMHEDVTKIAKFYEAPEPKVVEGTSTEKEKVADSDRASSSKAAEESLQVSQPEEGRVGEPVYVPVRTDEIPQEYMDFFKSLNDKELVDVLHAADYMGVKHLVNIGSNIIANELLSKGLTMEEIDSYFDPELIKKIKARDQHDF